MACICQACGRDYKVDLLLPDKLWEEIKPFGKPVGAGLLCGACILNRLENMGTYQSHTVLPNNYPLRPSPIDSSQNKQTNTTQGEDIMEEILKSEIRDKTNEGLQNQQHILNTWTLRIASRLRELGTNVLPLPASPEIVAEREFYENTCPISDETEETLVRIFRDIIEANPESDPLMFSVVQLNDREVTFRYRRVRLGETAPRSMPTEPETEEPEHTDEEVPACEGEEILKDSREMYLETRDNLSEMINGQVAIRCAIRWVHIDQGRTMEIPNVTITPYMIEKVADDVYELYWKEFDPTGGDIFLGLGGFDTERIEQLVSDHFYDMLKEAAEKEHSGKEPQPEKPRKSPWCDEQHQLIYENDKIRLNGSPVGMMIFDPYGEYPWRVRYEDGRTINLCGVMYEKYRPDDGPLILKGSLIVGRSIEFKDSLAD